MSVVEIKNRVVNDEQIFQDASLSDRSFLHLEGGLPPEHFSVELSVGDTWNERYGTTSSQMYRIPEDGLHLPGHGSIVVEVAEHLRVPHNMYGIVMPTGSLFLDRGILIAPAKVEPSYTGTLKLRLFNTTSYKHRLKRGEKVASIVFFSTENTSFQPSVTKASAAVDRRVPMGKRASSWASRNVNQIITWLIAMIFSSLSAWIISHHAEPKTPRDTQSNGLAAHAIATPNDKGN